MTRARQRRNSRRPEAPRTLPGDAPVRRGWGNASRRCAVVTAVALALLVMPASGCSTLSSPDDHLIEPGTEALSEPSLPYRVGVVPLVVDEVYRERVEEVRRRAGNREFAYVPDEELALEMMDEVVQGLKQLNAVDEARLLPHAAARPFEATVRDAFNDGFDLVIRPVLRRYDCRYVGSTGAYIPSVFIWFFVLQGLTWWIAEETFASETAMALEVYATTGEPDPLVVRDVVGEVACNLNDFQRGFNLFNLFRTPSGLSESQWHTIGGNLLPLSRQAAQREMLSVIADPEEGLNADVAAVEERVHKRLAIVCGTQAQPGLGRRFAVADALRMRELLLDSPAAPIRDERALTTLEGARATPAALERAIRELFVRHGRARDQALLFLSGQGVIDAEGRSWLLLADSEVEDLSRTAVPLERLARWLDATEARVTVIAAVAFNRLGELQGAPQVELQAELQDEPQTGIDAVAFEGTFDPWEPLERLEDVALISATSGMEPVLEIDAVGASLFVDELAHLLTDGGLSSGAWTELTHAWLDNVRELAMFEGEPQSPQIRGSRHALNDKRPFFHIGETGE